MFLQLRLLSQLSQTLSDEVHISYSTHVSYSPMLWFRVSSSMVQVFQSDTAMVGNCGKGAQFGQSLGSACHCYLVSG